MSTPQEFPLVDIQSPILEISPSQIIRDLVLKQESVFEIRLQNLTNNPVSFKVKTTTPDRCQVRPILNTIAPNGTSKCTVVMAPFDTLPDPDDKRLCHKFLFLSIPLPPGTTDIATMWRSAEAHHRATNETIFYDQRVYCNFRFPSTDAQATESARFAALETDLNEKKKQFDSLMEFSIKQNSQMRTLTGQLQTREEDIKNHKLTIMNLEKQILNLTKAQAEQREAAAPRQDRQNEPVQPGIVGQLKVRRNLATWQILAVFILAWFLAYFIHGASS